MWLRDGVSGVTGKDGPARGPYSADVLLPLLRCPRSGQPLTRRGEALVTEDSRHDYPIVREVPILIDDTQSIFSVAQVTASSGGTHAGALRRLARRLTPSPTRNTRSRVNYATYRRMLEAMPTPSRPRPRVLVVGGGVLGDGADHLTENNTVDLVETDVYLGPRVDVVCDGQQLPFRDGSFDGVVIQAVLEHVLDPVRVVGEIHRVLRPDGLVYAETPFMQQVHEGEFDFIRFTDLGHRRLFCAFDEIERGAAVGPATAFVWSARYLARSLPRRSAVAGAILDRAVTFCLFWLKYLDDLIADHAGARDGASGVFFLGQRRDSPLSDRELVATYQGTVASATRQRQARGQVSPARVAELSARRSAKQCGRGL